MRTIQHQITIKVHKLLNSKDEYVSEVDMDIIFEIDGNQTLIHDYLINNKHVELNDLKELNKNIEADIDYELEKYVINRYND